MLDPIARPLKDALLAPFVRIFASVHPHAISTLALAVGLACAASAAYGAFAAAIGLWTLNRVLDGLDGTVARRTGKQTDLGGYLDLVFDFVVYAAVPLGVAAGAAQPGISAWPAAAFLLASFYVNAASWLYLSAVLEKRATAAARDRDTAVVMPEGIIAGTETVFFFFLFLLFPSSSPVLFSVMAVLVMATALQRVILAVTRIADGRGR
jgi:phosphatidylglycerophosphate synthase